MYPYFREIERWVAEGDQHRILGLIIGLTPQGSSGTPKYWQYGSILDHLRRQLAMNPGRQNLPLLLKQLVHEGMHVVHLRESAARFAEAQESQAIVAALEECEARRGVAEFMYILAHEAALRRKIDDTIPIARRLAARMVREGHPLSWLPLRLTDLEVEASAFLRQYSSQGSSNSTATFSWDTDEGRGDPEDTSEFPPTYREITSPERAERVIAPIKPWLDQSNGRFEVRFFEFEKPLPPRSVCPSLLRPLGLESLGKAGDEAIHLKKSTAPRGFSHLFCAAANGGAYTSGEGGAYGRLAAWQSIAALTGCSSGEIGRIFEHAMECSWYSFWNEGEWFYNVAWDLALAVLAGDGKTLAFFAASDTD